MRHPFPAVVLVLASCLAAPAPAAESYDNCSGTIASLPVVISTQGVWCLKSDLSSALASGNMITIATNNVTIECNGFKLGGLGAGPGSDAKGIVASDRLNIVIRACNVRGFATGVQIVGGGGHVVEDSRFDGNLYRAIELQGDASVIRRNLVADTNGGADENTVVAIYTTGRVDIVDNMVDTVGPGNGAAAEYGIVGGQSASIIGNRVVGVDGGGAGAAFAIVASGLHAVVEANHVYGGVDGIGTTGVYCTSATSLAKDNVIRETSADVATCLTSNNIYIP